MKPTFDELPNCGGMMSKYGVSFKLGVRPFTLLLYEWRII